MVYLNTHRNIFPLPDYSIGNGLNFDAYRTAGDMILSFFAIYAKTKPQHLLNEAALNLTHNMFIIRK